VRALKRPVEPEELHSRTRKDRPGGPERMPAPPHGIEQVDMLLYARDGASRLRSRAPQPSRREIPQRSGQSDTGALASVGPSRRRQIVAVPVLAVWFDEQAARLLQPLRVREPGFRPPPGATTSRRSRRGPCEVERRAEGNQGCGAVGPPARYSRSEGSSRPLEGLRIRWATRIDSTEKSRCADSRR